MEKKYEFLLSFIYKITFICILFLTMDSSYSLGHLLLG